MSTSLKVVSMAAVFCASFRRRAIVWRSRVICTRSSRAASLAGDVARCCTGAETGVGFAAARSIALSMSPLVTCPCRPVPLTFDGSTPLSAAIFRTEGGTGISGDFCGAAGAGFETSAGFAAGAEALGAAQAPSLIWPSSAPTATVSPFFTATSDNTPAAGAGTSSVTLSVSSSTNGSSTATASPGCLNHFPTVASVTDSPRVGTRMSAMSRLPSHSLCLATIANHLPQRLVEEVLELRQMLRHLPDCSRCRCRATCVAHGAVLGSDLVEDPLQENIDEEPGAHIARLFLAPDHLRLLEPGKLRDQCLGREWIKLLDPQDINVIDAAFLAFLVEVVIDLARAH